MQEALERRRPQSRRSGRPGTPVVVVIRMLVLKHLYRWSFDECEREVRANLVYRSFCRVGLERVADAKTLIRLSKLIDEQTLKTLLSRLVEMARKRNVIRGYRMRVDTTVVETNIHYPTDSSLLKDGIGILQRGVKKLGSLVSGIRMRDRSRSVQKRVFEIARLSRQGQSETAREKKTKRYRELMALARKASRETMRTIRSVAQRKVAEPVKGKLRQYCAELREKLGLLGKVLEQTAARILGGDTHHPGKVLSLFEPHSEAIRKGKSSKPTEFGKLVKIQEAENQFITDYEVLPKRAPDQTLWEPSLKRHLELFGRAPRIATADAGFSSAANRKVAAELGVRHIALPGKLRSSTPKQRRALRKALRWRTGAEGRISALKRRHGLDRSRYRGVDGMKRWVAFGVIANNVLACARTVLARE